MSTEDDMSTEIARRRIESFSKRFGKGILTLAYHAAFPIALTPDLLYRLWANFQQDVDGNAIPWVAVSNLLLSTLVNEVGYELYEMDGAVRNQLLRELNALQNFGPTRIKELSAFLQAYIKQKLKSNDPYERDFAKAQQWTAEWIPLAFVEPSRAARELASKLQKEYNRYNEQNQDKYDLLRLASLIETLAEPLKDYKPLLIYSRGIVNSVLDHNERAISEFKNFPIVKSRAQVQKIILSPPPQKPAPKEQKFEDFIENLDKYKEYSESILQELQWLKQNPSSPNQVLDNPKLQDCLKKLQDTANKTVDLVTSPVKVAVLEKFNRGQTLLVGSLASGSDALRVRQIPIPTTDKVTAIDLLQQDGFKTTEYDDFTIEYLDRLKPLYEEARTAVNELRQQQNVLKRILSDLDISLEESPALNNLRDSLRNMKSTYNRFKNNLGKEPLKDARGVAINDVIKDEVTYRILEWRQWNLLFERAQNGIIVLPVIKEDRDNPFGRKRNSIDNIPTKSDDFYDEFHKTVRQLKSFADQKIQEAITNFLKDLSKKVSSEIKRIKTIFREEMGREIENKFDAEQAEIFDFVYKNYNPEKWQEDIIKETTQEEKSVETQNIFPLARKDENHDFGQIFDWAPEHKQNSSRTAAKHLFQVLRLRDKLTTRLSLHLGNYVGEINKKVDQAILTKLNELIFKLNALLRKEALLRYIVYEQQEINEVDFASLIISQIASSSSPDISSQVNGNNKQ